MAVHDATPVLSKTLSVLVENRAGVLSQVVGLFSARGFNIISLAVGETEDPTMSRITLVTSGDLRTMDQIKKQLNKLINVIKVQDLSEEEFVDRELMLVKMANNEKTLHLIAQLSKYRIQMIDENPKTITLECTETRENTKKVFDKLKEAGIIEIAQTGAVALSKKPPKD